VAEVFTDEERSLILHYLGYPKEQLHVAAGNLGYRMNNTAMDYVTTSFYRLDPAGAERVREGLRQLKCIDEALSSLYGKAHVKRTGDIELDAAGGRRHLLAERRRQIRQMADDLAVPINPLSSGGCRVSNT